MKDKDRPSPKPININEDVWIYEAAKSLDFVAYGRNSDGSRSHKPAHFRISWRKLKATFPGRAKLKEGGNERPRNEEF